MLRGIIITVGLALPFCALACGNDDNARFDGGSDGNSGGSDSTTPFGDGSFKGGDGGDGGDGSCGPNLTGVIRDFSIEGSSWHPDFEHFLGDDKGIVATTLGSDFKPVYANTSGTTPTTTGKANFDQWYNDVPGVNFSSLFQITLAPIGGGVTSYDNPNFFPVDGQGWGNQGQVHNFGFTFELHTTFAYQGGESFTFTGDDDLWTFINGHLAIDIGGVHGAESQSINLDTQAGALGIVVGQTYPLDIFTAERHTSQSDIRIDTTISFNNCNPIIH